MYKNGNPVWSLWLNGERFDRNIIGMEGDFVPQGQDDIKLFHTLNPSSSGWDILDASHDYHYVIEATANDKIYISCYWDVQPSTRAEGWIDRDLVIGS